MQFHPCRESYVRTIFDKSLNRRKDPTEGTDSGPRVISVKRPCNQNWCSPRCRLTDCRYCPKEDARMFRPQHVGDYEWQADNLRKKNRFYKCRKAKPLREKRINFRQDSCGNNIHRYKENLNEKPYSSICCYMHTKEINKIPSARDFPYENFYGIRKAQWAEEVPAWDRNGKQTDSRESEADLHCTGQRQCSCFSKRERHNKRNHRNHYVRRTPFPDQYEKEKSSEQYLQHISPVDHLKTPRTYGGIKYAQDSMESILEGRQKKVHEKINEMILDSIRDLRKSKRNNEGRICHCEYSNHLKINEDDVTYMKFKLREALDEIKKCNRNVEKSLISNQEDSNNQDLCLSIVNDCQKRCTEIEKRIQELCKELNSFQRNGRNSIRQFDNNIQERNGKGNLVNEEQGMPSRGYFENKEDRPTRDVEESEKSISLENNEIRTSLRRERQRSLRIPKPCKCQDSERSSRAGARNSKRKDKGRTKTPRTRGSALLSPNAGSKTSNGPAEGTSVGSDSLKVGGACYHIRCFPSDQVLDNPKFVKCRGYKEVIDKMRKKRDFRRLTKKHFT